NLYGGGLSSRHQACGYGAGLQPENLVNHWIALFVFIPLPHEVRGSCLSQIGLPSLAGMAFLDDQSRIL
ncbi:hypothetical protein, partial [Synechococcus sp. R60.3]|uniref:hypothetical protein n=1 Tax=Synechococcus sp. R60.3 TaxID=2967123 RepID=UPI0039C018DD